MAPKLLTESGWKSTASKFKIKDNGLQRALAAYEDLEDDEHEDRIEGIAAVSKLAGALKRAREVAPEVVEYLDDIVSAAESEKREITKAKAAADKAAAASQKKAVTGANKAGEDDDEDEDEEEEEEEEVDYSAKLLAAFQKLKGAKDTSYQFLVCDAKPVCGVMVAKKITPKHKEQLTKATGGGKRFLPVGTCSFQDGKFTFSMDKPVSGLARKLQESIKNFTGKKLPIKVGAESAEDEEEPLLKAIDPDLKKGEPSGEEAPKAVSGPLAIGGSVGRGGRNTPEDVQAIQEGLNRRIQAGLTVDGKCSSSTIAAIEEFQKLLGQFKPDGLIEPKRGTARALASNAKLGPPPERPKPIAPPKLAKGTLATAPIIWHSTRNILNTNIEALKKGVRAEYSPEDPQLLRQIDESMAKLSGILGKLDTRLADSLTKANASGNDAARKAELKNAKTILTDYINYVKSEPLIGHVDSNPFGVETNLKKVLMDSLTNMAQAIG